MRFTSRAAACLLAIAALSFSASPASAQPAPAAPDAAQKIFNCDDPPGVYVGSKVVRAA